MSFNSWLPTVPLASTTGRRERYRRRSPLSRAAARFRPRLDLLEDRTLLSGVSFSNPTSFSVGPNGEPESVAVGDFNGDGKLDLVTPNAFSNSVSVLVGNGDGTFQTAQSYGTGTPTVYDFPVYVAVADFNGDHKPDLVVANKNSNSVSVLVGNGDGTFQTAMNFGVGASPVYVAVGDLNGDHKLDLVVANEFSDTISVLLGNGDGTFQAAQDFATGGRLPVSLSIADFNGDGKPDLAIANQNGGTTVSVLLGNGDGTFQTAQSFVVGGTPNSMAVADFNGDGKEDLAVTTDSNVSVLLGNGDGTFQATQDYAATGTGTVAVGDFNSDGKLDLVAVDRVVSVLLGNGDGTFQADQDFDAGGEYDAAGAAVGDFNGDGRPDLAVANVLKSSVSVLLNDFVTTTALSGPSSSSYAQSVTYTAKVESGGAPVTMGVVTFVVRNPEGGVTPFSATLPLDASGEATVSLPTLDVASYTISGVYNDTPAGAGTGFGPSTGTASLIVNPLVFTGTGIDFSAIAGAPFTGAVATFANPDPSGNSDSFMSAIIDWGDGSTSNGAITDTGTLTVTGSHTYIEAGTNAVRVQILDDWAAETTATGTAMSISTVSTLGQSVQSGLTGDISFWHGKTGQALINSFNGGSYATALASWLAASFPNLYGVGAETNNLTGEINAQVAAFFKSQAALPGSNLEAQVLATALNVYATTLSLGGTVGQSYGFTVSADGLGADSFNVGADGAAFGVAKKTTLNVYELLKAVDRQSVLGVLYDGDAKLQKLANHRFHALNGAGSIS
jgi:hypothetical protein